jgi:hypothetical protein
MTQPANIDLTINVGTTFEQNFIYGQGSARKITDIERGLITTVTAVRHGFKTGQEITISGVKGSTEINDQVFIIIVLDDNRFTLDGLDSTTYGIYLEAGIAIVPVNISGYSAIMQIRSKPASDEVVVQLSSGGGEIAIGGTNGKIGLTLSALVTTDLKKGKYYYDLKLISATNIVSRFLEGRVEIDSQVTR